MGWLDVTEQHEGYVARVFADGKHSGATAREGVIIDIGTPDQKVRPYDEVAAWQVRCGCGWTAPVRWLEFEADKDIDRRWAEPTEQREDELMEEWRVHVAPEAALWRLADLDNARDQLTREIEDQVITCRRVGASWSQIGHTLAMSKQGAEQKYGAMVRSDAQQGRCPDCDAPSAEHVHADWCRA